MALSLFNVEWNRIMPSLPMRLAMRTTDDGWWIALIAPIESYDGAIEIGRIRRSVVEDSKIRHQFIEVMKEALTFMVKELKGQTISEWQEQKPMPPSKGTA
jgi:hypothetical protein